MVVQKPTDVLLMTDEAQTVRAVSAVLGVNGSWTSQCVYSSSDQVKPRLLETPEAAVMVDIDPAPDRVLGEMDVLSRRFCQARFIVLSRAISSELVLRAMQAGARHFLLKSSIGSDLSDVLHRLMPRQEEPAPAGTAITVLSASGGCGATTLAVNLAAELYVKTSEPALIVDLDCSYGAAGSWFGRSGQYGITDILEHNGAIDSQLIASTATAYSQGLHILLSPASIRQKPCALQPARLPQLVEAARGAYRHVIIDAPRVPMETASALARQSALTLIALQLTVKDVRSARALYSGLLDAGVQSDAVIPVLSRHRSRHLLLGLDEAKKTIGVSSLTYLTNDFRSAIRAADLGQPLAEAAPRSSLRRDICELAGQLLETIAALSSSTQGRVA
jgi:pilus assembly protein CpaE